MDAVEIGRRCYFISMQEHRIATEGRIVDPRVSNMLVQDFQRSLRSAPLLNFNVGGVRGSLPSDDIRECFCSTLKFGRALGSMESWVKNSVLC